QYLKAVFVDLALGRLRIRQQGAGLTIGNHPIPEDRLQVLLTDVQLGWNVKQEQSQFRMQLGQHLRLSAGAAAEFGDYLYLVPVQVAPDVRVAAVVPQRQPGKSPPVDYDRVFGIAYCRHGDLRQRSGAAADGHRRAEPVAELLVDGIVDQLVAGDSLNDAPEQLGQAQQVRRPAAQETVTFRAKLDQGNL